MKMLVHLMKKASCFGWSSGRDQERGEAKEDGKGLNLAKIEKAISVLETANGGMVGGNVGDPAKHEGATLCRYRL
jgi:hypothetical protein